MTIVPKNKGPKLHLGAMDYFDGTFFREHGGLSMSGFVDKVAAAQVC